MSMHCSDCAYCVNYIGKARCGRAIYGYKFINETDEACYLFELFTSCDEEEP